jgi:uroporphyrinogen-III synthase
MGMREVLLVRALGGDDRDAQELRRLGVPVVEDPYLTVSACADAGAPERARHVLASIAGSADWLVVTSQAALRALAELAGADALGDSVATGRARGIRFAAVGRATAETLAGWGASDVLVPATATAAGLLARLSSEPPASVIAPQGGQAMKGLAGGLRDRGWAIDEVVVYETATAVERPPTADRLAAGHYGAIVLRSPTAVRAVTSFAPAIPEATVVVCGGPTTAAAATAAGLQRLVVSPEPTADALAATVLGALSAGKG